MLNEKILQMLSPQTKDQIVSWREKQTPTNNLVIPSGSGRSFVISLLAQKELKGPTLIVCRNEDRAYRMAQDIETWTGEKAFVFPQREILPFETIPESPQVVGQRIQVLYKALEKKSNNRFFVTTSQALQSALVPPQVLEEVVLRFKVGERIAYNKTIQHLINIGYKRFPQVTGLGEFSVRGDILDIFPLSGEPVRIEFFDDEVDSIRFFDPEDQRSTEPVTEIEILPARECYFDKNNIAKGKEKILHELQEQLTKLRAQNYFEEADELEAKVKADLDKFQNGQSFDGELGYLIHFYGREHLFLEYVKPELIIYEDQEDLVRQTEYWLQEIGESLTLLMEKGRVLPSVFENFHSLSEIQATAKNIRSFSISEVGGDKDSLELRLRQPNIYQGPVETAFPDDVEERLHKLMQVGVIVSTTERQERVTRILQDRKLSFSSEKAGPGVVFVQSGNLESGLESLSDNLVIITDRELFGGAKRKKKPIFSQGKVLHSKDQLKTGDYVVHVNHGIGRYTGMNTLEINGTHKDYLVIQYAGEGEKLYIPTEQIQLLQKYSGLSDDAPKLNKLGGSEWQKVKARVNASVQAMAEELIALYAARESIRGHAFSPDDDFQKQFEDEFPYQETPDQLKSINEVKTDMVKPQPMERLLCGDVGYGKTEVAIRAAFKAASEGKQVAILVPTTILGMQHYNTFRERFRNYPFNIRLLSRFQPESANRDTLRKMASGGVDIVIGTHRLLSKDIKFKDLGLVIIDEEQRFGVSQKEKLKYLRKNVDVLTMTATPIPRTLHMALVGVRDMSLIETPPEDRYPVRTYVTEYNPETVREAILRELARKGQVYFVFNRVQGIEEMAAEVQNLVPEARIGVAHGQMDEKYLERVMVQFMEREYDILVSTTIIETGLDISNVNTLIVYNADHFGLSQLYQLRGRVGRTNRVAYAYFTYKPNKALNEDAQKRLSAIRDFTELGSGFKLAMRDLEIRGAGNILGPEQHGFIAAVGFELYCQMLEEAVAQRKMVGEIEPEEQDPQINITLDGYLPTSYIADEGQKIEIYKKINDVNDLDSLTKLEDEMIDRFGDLPEEAENLLWFKRIDMLARALIIEEITEQREIGRDTLTLALRFSAKSPIDGNKIQQAWEKYRNKIGFVHGKSPQLKLANWQPKTRESRRLLLNILEILAGANTTKGKNRGDL